MGRVRFGLVILLVVQILVLGAMAHSEVQPREKGNYEIAERPVSSEEEGGTKVAEAQAPENEIRRLGKHRYTDKSMAGGGVIIGGLVTAIFAAVFCYIRVTRKRNNDDNY